MITLDDALDLACREGLEVRYHNFTLPLVGIAACYPNRPPIIGLDKSLLQNCIKHKEVLTEEIGHVFTGTGNAVPRNHYVYRDKRAVMKCESQGLVWQVHYLIPYRELVSVMQSGQREMWQLAEYFEVSHRLMWRRLNMADAAKLRRMGA